jgi:hypothetical protein
MKLGFFKNVSSGGGKFIYKIIDNSFTISGECEKNVRFKKKPRGCGAVVH